MRSVEQLDENLVKIESRWIAEARIVNASPVGEWRIAIKDTVRFSYAMIRFRDNGRAAGYWVGVQRFYPPLYGY